MFIMNDAMAIVYGEDAFVRKCKFGFKAKPIKLDQNIRRNINSL